MKYIILMLITSSAFAQLPKLYTTRLLSTSGAGVASILANEAAILNPAPIAFLSLSSFYYQKDTNKLESPSSNRVTKSSDSGNQLYLIADTSSSVKGTFSYQRVNRNGYEKNSYVSSLASLISKRMSLGFIYRYNQWRNTLNEEDKYHDLIIGLTYIQNSKLTLGFTYEDPFKSSDDSRIAKLGAQYKAFKSIILIQDFSLPTDLSASDNLGRRSAIQLNIFRDLFLRFGNFEDKYEKKKGSSYGISWIGPKLSLEYAMMNSRFTEDTNFNFKDEEEVVSSFSVSLRF